MTLSLKEASAIAALAESLYTFLSGSGQSAWKGHVTFATVAQKVGAGEYWQGGSKAPAIRALLEGVLRHRRDRFEPLILAIVSEGMPYRRKQQKPVTSTEIKTINGHVLEIGFKFPELWDPAFLASLETWALIANREWPGICRIRSAFQRDAWSSSARGSGLGV